MIVKNLEEVITILLNIFPSYIHTFKEDFEDENETVDTFHRLFMSFLYFYGKNIENFSLKQFQELANFINESIEINNNLENAISTCFLEALNDKNTIQPLKVYLSKKAKLQI